MGILTLLGFEEIAMGVTGMELREFLITERPFLLAFGGVAQLDTPCELF
jgi:hypothetical protein